MVAIVVGLRTLSPFVILVSIVAVQAAGADPGEPMAILSDLLEEVDHRLNHMELGHDGFDAGSAVPCILWATGNYTAELRAAVISSPFPPDPFILYGAVSEANHHFIDAVIPCVIDGMVKLCTEEAPAYSDIDWLTPPQGTTNIEAGYARIRLPAVAEDGSGSYTKIWIGLSFDLYGGNAKC